MRPLTGAQLATVRAVALAVEVGFHLPFHHHFLKGLQQRFAVCHREAQGLRREIVTFNTGQFADRFLTIRRW